MSDDIAITNWLRAHILGNDVGDIFIREGILAALNGSGSDQMRKLTVDAICGRIDKDWQVLKDV